MRSYAGMLLGSVLYGAANSWFLFPFQVAPGGIGGLSQILYRYTSMPEGFWMLCLNVPLFILGWVALGRQFGLKSFIATMISTGMCWVFMPSHFTFLPDYADLVHNIASPGEPPRLAFFLSGSNPVDVLLASIAGSTMLGIGLGLIFKSGGSTGGTDIPVAILRKYTGLSISSGYWIVESLIILSAGFAFSNAPLVIWAYMNLFLCSRVTDLAAEGMPYVKAAFIMSSRSDALRDAILDELDRGVTLLKAEGGFSRKPKEVIYVCVHRRQVRELEEIVRSVDPHAFMVLHDAHDVMGYGFRRRTLAFEDQHD
ncbi:MAG TPA: YitT family protein [Candidatus Fermentibacter daniensis]|nr:MAG: hypothetical protein AO395_03070 [Candidatus Fermentibacter daniensis]MBP7720685.1 YitT family protein [Candidatus Fermentibacter sp.]KZD17112.1 MAG: hypothetical protein AO396_03860 [Candidatus Fermentibacter daniensis]KZD18478.1 MAG: hypothetical protein AO394_02905 [Candidatus Fermentibacter daniensis]MCC6872599.1 YitT family protein [Candidatus Fermentibacter sp.]